MLAIARALMIGPRVMLDEPSAGLARLGRPSRQTSQNPGTDVAILLVR
jgi:ABC-type branched-subunit amino acid transport system ATPase component